MEDTTTETIPAPSPVETARAAALKAFDDLQPDAAEPAVEAAPEPVVTEEPAQPVPNPTEVAVAERIAEIVRAESALVAKQQSMRGEVDAARAELKRATDELAAMKAQLAENPMELLRANRWELEDIVKVAATKQTPEAVRIAKLEAEMARRDKLEAERAEQGKAATAAQEAEAARAKLVNEYIPAQLAVAKEDLPLCNAWFEPDELAREVYAIMGQEYARSKVALEPAEAARRVEAALRKRVEKVNPPSLVTQGVPKQQKTQKPTVKPSATVTNSQTQHRTAADEQVKPGDLDGYRRRALAIAADFFDRA